MKLGYGVHVVQRVAIGIVVLLSTDALFAQNQPQPSAESQPAGDRETCRLGVLLDGSDIAAVDACSWVVLIGSATSEKQETNFRRPLLYPKLAKGKYHVSVIPCPGSAKAGYCGSGDVEITDGGLSTIRIKVKELKGVAISANIQRQNGEPLGNTDVSIEDVTEEQSGLSRGGRTNKEGHVTFYGFSERQYRFAAVTADATSPVVAPSFSEKVKVDDKPREIEWKIDPGPLVKLLIIDDLTGQPLLKTIKYLCIFADNGQSMSFSALDGQLLLPKNVGVLSGTKHVRLEVVSQGTTGNLTITKNAAFDIDNSNEQVVKVTVGPLLTGWITPECQGIGASVRTSIRAIAANDGDQAIKLLPGRKNQVPVGSYNVIEWADGYKSTSQPVKVADKTTTTIVMKLEKAPEVVVTVSDVDGKPVLGYGVVVRYTQCKEWISEGVADAKGEVRVPVDWAMKPCLYVYDKTTGTCVLPLDGLESQQSIQIRAKKPCLVSGEIEGLPAARSGSSGKETYMVIWVPTTGPKRIIQESDVTAGKYVATLQSGTYVPYIKYSGNVIPMPAVEVKTGKDVMVVGKFVVTPEVLSKKLSFNQAGIE
jgi:hypothetical protein